MVNMVEILLIRVRQARVPSSEGMTSCKLLINTLPRKDFGLKESLT